MSTEGALGKLILLVGAVLPSVAAGLVNSGTTTQATLEWVRENGTRAYIATLIDLAAVPFLLGGVVVYWISTREASLRFASLAGLSLTIGYVGLAAQHGSQALAFSLAGDESTELTKLAEVIDADKLALVVQRILAFGGWLVGVLLALGAMASAPTLSKLGALGLLSVPFTLAIPALEPEVTAALFAGAFLVMVIPIRRTRTG